MNKVKEINDLEEGERNIGWGSLWKVNSHYLLLAQVDTNKMCLIDLEEGNRWSEPTRVKSVGDITLTEWTKITGDTDSNLFSRIPAIEIRGEYE